VTSASPATTPPASDPPAAKARPAHPQVGPCRAPPRGSPAAAPPRGDRRDPRRGRAHPHEPRDGLPHALGPARPGRFGTALGRATRGQPGVRRPAQHRVGAADGVRIPPPRCPRGDHPAAHRGDGAAGPSRPDRRRPARDQWRAVHRAVGGGPPAVALHRGPGRRRGLHLRRRRPPGHRQRHRDPARHHDGAHQHARPARLAGDGSVCRAARLPAAHPHRGHRRGHRSGRPHATHPGPPGRRRGDLAVAQPQHDARAHRVLVRGARGQRGADAPVRRRRLPRAAHPAGDGPRLRRALPPGRRARPRGRRRRHGADRGRVRADERPRRGPPHARPHRRRPRGRAGSRRPHRARRGCRGRRARARPRTSDQPPRSRWARSHRRSSSGPSPSCARSSPTSSPTRCGTPRRAPLSRSPSVSTRTVPPSRCATTGRGSRPRWRRRSSNGSTGPTPRVAERLAAEAVLGLAIVAAIVARHQGQVGVARTPGGGATFVVRLPQRPSSPHQRPVAQRTPSN
jgi:hypothetical protein